MARSLALVVVIALAHPTFAQCKLSPLAPMKAPAALDHRANAAEPLWPHLALVYDRGTQQATLVDPLDPRRMLSIPVGAKIGVFTPTRAVVVVNSGDERQLLVGAARPNATLKPALQADLAEVIDAVDGAGGETFVAFATQTIGGTSGLFVARVDGAGKLTQQTLIQRGQPLHARIARLADGRLAVAYVTYWRAQYYPLASLWVAWLDGKGALVGKPERIDAARGDQPYVDLALAPSGGGALVAWDPIGRVGKDDKKAVPIELRAFHVEPAAAKLVRRETLSSPTWVVAGSAGGILPNDVQAVSVGGKAILTWTAFAGEHGALWAAPGEGGVASSLLRDPPGDPRLRSDGRGAVFVFWDRDAGRHQRATLACAAAATTTAPPPLPPLLPLPSVKPLTASEQQQAWDHALALLAADAASAKQAAAMRAMTPDKRAAALAQLGEERHDGRYECVMAATTVDELESCDWP